MIRAIYHRSGTASRGTEPFGLHYTFIAPQPHIGRHLCRQPRVRQIRSSHQLPTSNTFLCCGNGFPCCAWVSRPRTRQTEGLPLFCGNGLRTPDLPDLEKGSSRSHSAWCRTSRSITCRHYSRNAGLGLYKVSAIVASVACLSRADTANESQLFWRGDWGLSIREDGSGAAHRLSATYLFGGSMCRLPHRTHP